MARSFYCASCAPSATELFVAARGNRVFTRSARVMKASSAYREISVCRICGTKNLESILDLGVQALASRFPRQGEPDPPQAPLVLARCAHCGLVQLLHSVTPGELYTPGYGYKSGGNATMQAHLAGLARWVEERCRLKTGDIIVDIGSNDGTLLKSFATPGLRRIGIDPIAGKFRDQYPNDVQLHESFFSAETYRIVSAGEKAKVATSVAMFYDLESLHGFRRRREGGVAPRWNMGVGTELSANHARSQRL